MRTALLIVSLVLGLVFGFQNCGRAGQSDLPGNSNVQLSLPVTPITPADPVTDPVVKNYILPGTEKPVYKASHLDWTLVDSSPEFAGLIKNLSSRCTQFRTTFTATKAVAPVILEEGLLPGDPKIAEMAPVRSALDQVFNVAFCAYFAETVEERDLSLKTVIDFIAEWNAAYVGDGNPINDRNLRSLFLVADLILPKMTALQYKQIRSLAIRLDKKEVAFMSALPATDKRLKNNWMIRHLMIRAHANLMTENTANMTAVASSLNTQLVTQYSTPPGFKLSTCNNLKSIGVYGSFDLQERDALVYHVSGLEEIMPFLTLRPDLVTATSRSAMLQAVNITQPFVLKEKSHNEFKCTTVQFDKDRVSLNPDFALPWDAYKARVMYRYGRLVFPSLLPWTGSFITPQYAPWLKIFLSGKGDKVNTP